MSTQWKNIQSNFCNNRVSRSFY